jgi:protein O-GlcNAc transferase
LKTSRNELCPCGSGKKFKKCCSCKADGNKPPGLAPSQHPQAPVQTELDPLIDLFNAGQFAQVEYRARQLAQQHAGSARVWNLLGVALQAQEKDAVGEFRRAAELAPNFAEAHSNLGAALAALGQFDAAVISYQRALAINPGLAQVHNNLGNALSQLGHIEGALACYQRAVQLKPEFSKAHFNLGAAQKNSGQLAAAVASLQRAVTLAPTYAPAHSHLGYALQACGQLVEAQACFRRALTLAPDLVEAHNGLLFGLSQSDAIEVGALVAEHRRFAERFEAPWRSRWPAHNNSRDPGRPLRLGFVSGDLRNHAVAHFIEPVWRHLNRSQFAVVAYHGFAGMDDHSQRLRALCDEWVDCVQLSDDALAARIRADQIDILFDLSGHTALNRLLVFARKPAPIQVSWIGYPMTSGLAAIDYRITDPFRAPPGMEAQFVEQLARLPTSGTFDNLVDAPAVNQLPALANGYVTFASFQRRGKLGDATLLLWSQVLQAVPGSRLLLGAMDNDAMGAELTAQFANLGIAADRVLVHKKVGIASYLALHHQVDMLLDSYPYPGGTTTNHGLWMGVPTLTRTGESCVSWQGAAVMLRAGLPQWVASSEHEFVSAAVTWANDLTALAALRSDLRKRILSSQLCQPETVARGLEAAMRTMWQRWCAGLVPEHFAVKLPSLEGDAGDAAMSCESAQK